MTVRYTADLGPGHPPERYDDRFVCRLHWTTEMAWWCGLDCPVERYRVGLGFLRDVTNPAVPDHRFVPDPRWDAARRQALT